MVEAAATTVTAQRFEEDTEGKMFRLRAIHQGAVYDVGCFAGFCLYAYNAFPDWNSYGNANRFSFRRREGTDLFDIGFGADMWVYCSGEHANGWYTKVAKGDPTSWDAGVSGWVFEMHPDNEACFAIKCAGAPLWLSDHAGAGGAWYLKTVGAGSAATAFRIQEYEDHGELTPSKIIMPKVE